MISGETLRLLRSLKKLKQKTIANKLGISQAAYSKMEKCKLITGERLEKLLKAINCTLVEIETIQMLISRMND